jgi:hypothetical protein
MMEISDHAGESASNLCVRPRHACNRSLHMSLCTDPYKDTYAAATGARQERTAKNEVHRMRNTYRNNKQSNSGSANPNLIALPSGIGRRTHLMAYLSIFSLPVVL